VERHASKVYGKASVGAPPMSVPHLDTRVINGKKALLFGPYAGFTPKFLKTGSLLDLPLSVKPNNILPMLGVASKEIALTIYLIKQILQTPKQRLEALKDYFPEAKLEDWELEIAGQRVQIIKKDSNRFGKLEFGTEVVSAADGSIAALLGASPGASTTTSIMLTLLDKCYPEQMKSAEWKAKLTEMIPSYGQSLAKNPELVRKVRAETAAALKLEP
jgi:malate dehydrogenase (quinone)